MRALLAVPALFAALALAGCGPTFGAGGNDPQNDAFSFCAHEVAATFDDPEGAAFSQWTGGGIPDEKHFEFEASVTADGQTFDLTCTVTGEQGDFELESYELVAP